ncbi:MULTISPECIES: hypothetical protein [Chryseobacterium group]|uniref:Uncharacterized protein n=1 Tax=Epilithonimonas lactis TaxID=421072 RepID=A0A085BI88_9FLAO|nr:MULTISPECIES: hypothetical protein [Chryseobacterium group]KFC20266.1 hypothetical protein IO90_13880 [Chryseobacterium sp. FH1]KFC22183.1 hypothetical protein IO89_09525 [Epilithonimonas lactis]SEQ57119.1 hypothetical protein SAMN04488097_2521 [Epilithonimonas lactis]
MKSILYFLVAICLVSCIRSDMDLKTLQSLISKNSFTNKLNVNDEMKFYRPDGVQDIEFEDFLSDNEVVAIDQGDFNQDGEEDYIANVVNNFNRSSVAPPEFFPIVITLKNGKYFIYKLDKFYDAKSAGKKLTIDDKDYVLFFHREPEENMKIKQDTFRFVNNILEQYSKIQE